LRRTFPSDVEPVSEDQGGDVIDKAQANQQTFAHAETICQEMRTQVPARRKRGPKPGTGRPSKMPRPRRRLKPRPPPEGRPVDAFGVKAARAYGSIAKTHQRPTHAARWAFQSQRSVRSMTASSPTDEYPGVV
jgi:hypothetical protein